MSKPDKPRDPPSEAPKHNPFAALRAKLGPLPPGPDAPPTPPKHARVTVRRERTGRGGKSVTLAEGPGLAGHDLEALARAAARALGTNARVENDALVLQGDQPDRLAHFLTTQGFPAITRAN